MNWILEKIYNSSDSLSLLYLIRKGGWLMIPLLFLSFLTVYIIILKAIELNNVYNKNEKWVKTLVNYLREGDKNKIQQICLRNKKFITARILLNVFKNFSYNIALIEKIFESEAKKEISKIENKIPLLGTIAGVAPTIGFLGTVTGFIQTFIKISKETSQVNPSMLSGGIYEAMITTAAGLIIGIISYLFYNFFLTKLNKIVSDVEYKSVYLLNALKYSIKSRKFVKE